MMGTFQLYSISKSWHMARGAPLRETILPAPVTLAQLSTPSMLEEKTELATWDSYTGTEAL